MINIYYTEKYWGHSQTMNGPQKVVKNLLQSLKDCNIPYAINEEIYDKTLFVHWSTDMLGYYYELKNKKNLLVGPQVWAWSNEFHQLKEYNKVLLPSKWCEDSMNKFFPKVKTGVWPVAIYTPEIEENIKALTKAAGFLRTKLSKRLEIRTVPKLQFFHDRSIMQGQKLSDLIDQAITADSKHDISA